MPAGNIISKAEVGSIVHVTPNAIDPTTVATTVLPNQVQMQWKGASEDPSGPGVMMYQIFRAGGFDGNYNLNPGFVDNFISPTTTYVYSIYTFDFHFNESAPVSVTVKTPPAYAGDRKQIGCPPDRSLLGRRWREHRHAKRESELYGSYRQGNGAWKWGVPFALSFNSQLWRKDYTDNPPNYAVWRLGDDVGYGFGWKLQAGSIRPYSSNAGGIAYWLYTISPVPSTGWTQTPKVSGIRAKASISSSIRTRTSSSSPTGRTG